jgi:hypothetical protein
MQRLCLLTSNAVVMVAAESAVADCALDHFEVGQYAGTIIVDASEVYRHWNTDYGENSSPFSHEYYELMETIFGTWNRVQPGCGYAEDPNRHFSGTPNVDYRLMLERVHASPALSLCEDVTPILTSDGDAVCVTDHPDFHLHLRYVVPDDPMVPYYVMYRFYDACCDPNDPGAGGYLPSRPFVIHFGAAPEYHALTLTINNRDYGSVEVDPEPPLPIVPGQGYDPNLEPNDPPCYPAGLSVSLTAVPVEGKRFIKWVIYDPNHLADANHAAEYSGNPIAVAMDADMVVEAKFGCGSGMEMLLLIVPAAMALAVLRRDAREGLWKNRVDRRGAPA